MNREALEARIWALKFDRAQLLNMAVHYERALMMRSARENRKGAEALTKAIAEYEKQLEEAK